MQGQPESWKFLEYIGVPKAAKGRTFDEYRWLSKISVFWKWYIRRCQCVYSPQLQPTRVKAYGFRHWHGTTDLTSLLHEVLVKSSMFPRPVLIASLDIRIAFDSMCHSLVDQACQSRGLDLSSRIAVLRQISLKRARMIIPSAGCTASFPFLRGGKQGGPEKIWWECGLAWVWASHLMGKAGTTSLTISCGLTMCTWSRLTPAPCKSWSNN